MIKSKSLEKNVSKSGFSVLRSSSFVLLILLFTFFSSAVYAAEKSYQGNWIKIVKSDFKLFVMNNDKVIMSYDVAVGRNQGQKQRAGDNRTPEGNFTVQQIQRSDYWSHDFRDGKGVIEKAYGPWFIRLKTGWKGIGIHGTHDPSSIGKNDTEGCIRLENGDLVHLKNNYIKIGMPVVIVNK